MKSPRCSCSAITALALDFLLGTSRAQAAAVIFTYTGADQTYTVPPGVTSLTVKLWGAGGASAGFGGGSGAFVAGTLAVTPGETLTLIVGGGGVYSLSDGQGGFGGGGGRSAIRSSSNVELVTAGAGGSVLGGASGGAGGGLGGNGGLPDFEGAGGGGGMVCGGGHGFQWGGGYGGGGGGITSAGGNASGGSGGTAGAGLAGLGGGGAGTDFAGDPGRFGGGGDSGASFEVQIDGTAGAGVPGGHDVLIVTTGPVSLGSTTLSLALAGTPAFGGWLPILEKQSAGAITGAFAGLPEGAVFTAGGTPFQITYQGGDGNGAGILNEGSLALTDCRLSGHRVGGVNSGNGGALYHRGPALVMLRCSLTGNEALGGGYGAALGADAGSARIEGCTFFNNTASGNGGGLVNFGAAVGMTNCTFTANSAGNGSGIIHYGNVLTLNHCTLVENTASFSGGGIERVGRPGNEFQLLNTLVANSTSLAVGPDAYSSDLAHGTARRRRIHAVDGRQHAEYSDRVRMLPGPFRIPLANGSVALVPSPVNSTGSQPPSSTAALWRMKPVGAAAGAGLFLNRKSVFGISGGGIACE
jgi:hypothetical protein